MSSNYTVIFDACVLYPAPLRSFLMYLALTGQFRARWSNDIHDEWIRNLLKQRNDIHPDKLARVRELMNAHVPGCLVEDYESLIPSISLPDVDDRHVVAAAIQTRAEAIITFNLKDFPDTALAPYNMRALHPDDFIMDLCDLNLATVLQAAQRHRASLKHPTLTAEEYLESLLRQKLPQTVSRLKPLHTAI